MQFWSFVSIRQCTEYQLTQLSSKPFRLAPVVFLKFCLHLSLNNFYHMAIVTYLEPDTTRRRQKTVVTHLGKQIFQTGTLGLKYWDTKLVGGTPVVISGCHNCPCMLLLNIQEYCMLSPSEFLLIVCSCSHLHVLTSNSCCVSLQV